jgi:hypothetical protein
MNKFSQKQPIWFLIISFIPTCNLLQGKQSFQSEKLNQVKNPFVPAGSSFQRKSGAKNESGASVCETTKKQECKHELISGGNSLFSIRDE